MRKHPEHGKDVYLRIERGQLLDSEYKSPVLVRFDYDQPISLTSMGPSDHCTETLFLGGNAFAVFSNRLKTAKTVRIEAPIYQGGTRCLCLMLKDSRRDFLKDRLNAGLLTGDSEQQHFVPSLE